MRDRFDCGQDRTDGGSSSNGSRVAGRRRAEILNANCSSFRPLIRLLIKSAFPVIARVVIKCHSRRFALILTTVGFVHVSVTCLEQSRNCMRDHNVWAKVIGFGSRGNSLDHPERKICNSNS